MLNHATTSVDTTTDVTTIVLVGAPASGKSTLRSLFSDFGVVGCDLESSHEAGDVVDDEWKQVVNTTLSAASEENPRIACIEGAISDTEVDYVTEQSESVLVIRVSVPDDSDRIKRHVERELDSSDVVTDKEVAEIETDSFRRHHYEQPYPKHDVSIINKDSTSTTELVRRCEAIVSAISATT